MARRPRAKAPKMAPEEIVAAYLRGRPLRWIESESGRALPKIRAEIEAAGVTIRPRGPAQSEQRKAARELMARRATTAEIVAATGLTVNNVHALRSYERAKQNSGSRA